MAFPRLRLWLSRTLGRDRAEREMDDEIRGFVDALTEEKTAQGLAPAEARRAALIEAGGVDVIKEATRDAAPARWLANVVRDTRYGLRLAWRSRGPSLAVVLTLALGIGATSATFSVVDNVLLRPLAYGDADRLVSVMHRRTNPVSPANYLDWQRQATVFSAMGAAEYWTPNLGGTSEPEKVFALRVSPEVLPMLGVPPSLGALPAAHGFGQVVIADGLWRRRFGADPGVIGLPIVLDGVSLTIAAVMPPDFRFAPFWATRSELWGPLDLTARATQRTGNSLRVFARLQPGTSIDAAREAMTALTGTLDASFPGTNRHVTVTPLKEMVVGDVRPAIRLLFAAVALVLLIACVNVAHVLFARAAARESEMSLRGALGAGRWRLVRQLLTESLVLAVAGGAAGLFLARWIIDAVRSLGASSIPRVASVTLDGHVVAFATGVSLLTTIVFGLAPAWRLSNPRLSATLARSERGATSGSRRRLSRLLIASEIALAVVLLVGAGLLMRSFAALRRVDPGFEPARLVSMVVSVTGTAEAAPDRRMAFYSDVVAGLRALPGVASASAINHMPLVGDNWGFPFAVEGAPAPTPGNQPTAAYRVVMPEYFRTVGTPMRAGRDFTARDRFDAPAVVIVNQFLAETYWRGQNPLGKRLRITYGQDAEWRDVVGVVKNAVRSWWADQPEEEVFLPVLQSRLLRDTMGPHASYLTFVVRSDGDPAAVVPSARAAVRSLSSAVPISEIWLMRDAVTAALNDSRFTLVLLASFAVSALVLAAIGVYGVMSHAVADQRRELGIRLALGATPAGVAWRLLREGLTLALAGAAVGLAIAALGGNAIATLLFGVQPFDPPTFVAVAAALVAVATIACLIPARRAGRIEPQRELR